MIRVRKGQESVMHGSTRSVIGLGLIWFLLGSVSAGEVMPPAGRLLVFLPEGVDWIALPVEGHDLDSARADFARRVFDSRDLDRNGVLEGGEPAKLLVWSSEQSRLRLLGDDWKAADTAPSDGKLTLGEWQTQVAQAFGPALRIVVDNQGKNRAGVLFSLVDQDHDGRLNAAELEQGAARLLRCDFDDDELITQSELAELRVAATEHADGGLETNPFLLLQGEDSLALAVREIEAHYRPSDAAGVPLQKIAGIDAASDTNSDGLLDSRELQQILKSPPTTGQLRITLQEPRGGVRWWAVGGDTVSPSTRRSDPVKLRGLAFDAKYLNTALLDQLQRQELLTQFRGADRDDNDYLSAQEYAEFVSVLDENLAPDPAMADLDRNQQITREEVTLFNELREVASRCQLLLTVQREMKSLFDALDQDHNKGVSGWEIHAGSEQVAALDRNKDGSLGMTELSGELSLLVGFASPRREESMQPPVGNRNPRVPRKTLTQASGPVWFQRMDRNQDQRVSWREFLGTRVQFQTLDMNRDGSIAVAEAR
jgi:Ca2+-binding EF-hand superfamily protein